MSHMKVICKNETHLLIHNVDQGRIGPMQREVCNAVRANTYAGSSACNIELQEYPGILFDRKNFERYIARKITKRLNVKRIRLMIRINNVLVILLNLLAASVMLRCIHILFYTKKYDQLIYPCGCLTTLFVLIISTLAELKYLRVKHKAATLFEKSDLS